eukprot:CAMPEP_0204501044 /NCGR_PEP_ID=MMETSP0471-20130131/98468_1 /ASSEMBLY_ACC=CAM_ASM_000602 /TAXON_ID=2969 /ORGANISM="Oxyrrhis marina" /LENGTH=57 /DNA_ID=CAMNT_0051505705 /DNA_START=88 /DNA_END=258 /DNA_ORIENTATION=-
MRHPPAAAASVLDAIPAQVSLGSAPVGVSCLSLCQPPGVQRFILTRPVGQWPPVAGG